MSDKAQVCRYCGKPTSAHAYARGSSGARVWIHAKCMLKEEETLIAKVVKFDERLHAEVLRELAEEATTQAEAAKSMLRYAEMLAPIIIKIGRAGATQEQIITLLRRFADAGEEQE
jgi:hypothetical protein